MNKPLRMWLGVLPRFKFPYRKFITKLTLILAWFALLFGASGSTLAFNATDQLGSLLAAEPEKKARPIAKLTQANVLTVSETDLDLSAANELKQFIASVKAETSEIDEAASAKSENVPDTDPAVPEIKMEIVAAEYVPPAIQPIGTALAGGGVFPYGQCTYYVALRRTVTWSGNAGQWYYNAQAQGYAVGQAPKAGSILVTWESPLGHVAYVEMVNLDGSFVVSEMNNYALGGWGIVNQRTITPGSVPLIGFVY